MSQLKRILKMMGFGFLFFIVTSASYSQGRSQEEQTFKVTISIIGASSSEGRMISSLCSKDENFPSSCNLWSAIPAVGGIVELVYSGVAPGEYAFATYHDVNKNFKFDLSDSGMPSEGMAYSNDIQGIPSFEKSAFLVDEDTRIIVNMLYFGQRR